MIWVDPSVFTSQWGSFGATDYRLNIVSEVLKVPLADSLPYQGNRTWGAFIRWFFDGLLCREWELDWESDITLRVSNVNTSIEQVKFLLTYSHIGPLTQSWLELQTISGIDINLSLRLDWTQIEFPSVWFPLNVSGQRADHLSTMVLLRRESAVFIDRRAARTEAQKLVSLCPSKVVEIFWGSDILVDTWQLRRISRNTLPVGTQFDIYQIDFWIYGLDLSFLRNQQLVHLITVLFTCLSQSLNQWIDLGFRRAIYLVVSCSIPNADALAWWQE